MVWGGFDVVCLFFCIVYLGFFGVICLGVLVLVVWKVLCLLLLFFCFLTLFVCVCLRCLSGGFWRFLFVFLCSLFVFFFDVVCLGGLRLSLEFFLALFVCVFCVGCLGCCNLLLLLILLLQFVAYHSAASAICCCNLLL